MIQTKHIAFVCALASIVLSSMVRAQKIIEFDFPTKKFAVGAVDKLNELEEGEFFQLKITNLNGNLFDVKLAYADSVVSKALSLDTTFGLDLIDALQSVFPDGAKAVESLKSVGIDMNSNDETQEQLENAIKEAGASETEKDRYVTKVGEIYQTLGGLRSDLNGQMARANRLLSPVYACYFSLLDLNTPLGCPITATQVVSGIVDIAASIGEIQGKLIGIRGDHTLALLELPPDIYKDTRVVDAAKVVTASIDSAIVAIGVLLDDLAIQKMTKSLTRLTLLRNNLSSTYTSLPIQLNGERGKLDITITPRDSEYLQPTYTTTLHFPKRSSTFYSVGLSYYYAGLHDSTFYVDQVNDTTMSVRPENQSGGETGVASLFRFGRRLDDYPKVGYHLAIGPGISISENVRPRLLLGGGFSFGRRHNFAVDFGAITGYVDRRRAALASGETVGEVPADLTVRKLEYDWFLALGYHYTF